MVDQAYENALKRKRELERELQEVDTFIKLWQRFARTEAERPAGGESPEVTEPEFGLTPSPQRGLSRDEVGRWAREIILQHGMPMTRGELVNAFEAKGLPIGGVDPSRNMGTIMWRLRENS